MKRYIAFFLSILVLATMTACDGARRGEGQPALRHDPRHPRGGTADLPR